MAAPWWLGQRSYFDNPDGGGNSGYVVTQDIDRRTGQQVFQQDGKYYYQLPRPEMGDGEGGTYAAAPGVLVDDSPAKSATFITNEAKGILAPYGNLGGEVGMVDGKPTYLYPMDRGATTAGDLGTYGGAQRAFWRSPSGAKGEVVKGPDGALWVKPPADAQFGEADTADHSTMLGQAMRDFGPIVAAAVSGGLLDGALGTAASADSIGAGMASAADQAAIQAAQGPTFGSVLQSAATSAGKNAAVQLATTGDLDPERALIAGVAGGAASVAPTIDTGLPMPVNAGLLSAGTTALAGGDTSQVLTAGVVGAGANLANTGMINAGVPNSVANAATSVGSALATGADPVAAGFGSVLNSVLSDRPLDYNSPIDTGVTTVSTAPLVGAAVTTVAKDLVADDKSTSTGSTGAAATQAAAASQYSFGSVLNPFTYKPAAWSTPPSFNDFKGP